MKLAKLNPILGNVEKIDRLFDPFLTGPLFPELMGKGFEGAWIPTLDLAENDAAFVVRCEVPGIPKENLDVRLTGEVLTISGHREAAIEAHYTDGVLQVTLPKAAPEGRSKITIK
jgi:HSP20 family molecular chaperone IbpA